MDHLEPSYLALTQPPTRLPPSSFPLIDNPLDPQAAYEAYQTLDTLISYRAEHQGSFPFLCPVDPYQKSVQEYTFAQCAWWIRLGAEHFNRCAEQLRVRCKGEEGKVVGMVGMSWVDYWINKMAIVRLYVPKQR